MKQDPLENGSEGTVPLKIEENTLERISILALQGRIVLGDGTDQLRDKVHELIDAGRNRLIVILSDVDYVDSSGLAVLISCMRTAQRKGGDLKLVHPSRRVKDILHITRLNTVLEAFDTLELAQASFQGTEQGTEPSAESNSQSDAESGDKKTPPSASQA